MLKLSKFTNSLTIRLPVNINNSQFIKMKNCNKVKKCSWIIRCNRRSSSKLLPEGLLGLIFNLIILVRRWFREMSNWISIRWIWIGRWNLQVAIIRNRVNFLGSWRLLPKLEIRKGILMSKVWKRRRIVLVLLTMKKIEV